MVVVWWGGLLSTLLGPEATGCLLCPGLSGPPRVGGSGGGWGVGVGCFMEDTGHRVVRRPAGVPVLVCAGCLVGSSVA